MSCSRIYGDEFCLGTASVIVMRMGRVVMVSVIRFGVSGESGDLCGVD